MKNNKNIRLTNNVVPEEYTIKIKPDLEAFVFVGEEIIRLILKKSTSTVTLHCKALDIESAQVISKTGTLFATKIKYNEKAETATFIFPKNLSAGEINLRIIFNGVLNDKMRGFYRSSYTDSGKNYFLATTQFESTDARQAFPCFDEPAMKAVFNISLVVPKDKTAISNTVPIEILEHEGGYKTVQFLPTPRMSTYLVAFIVGNFTHIKKNSDDGVLVRVFTTPGKTHQAEFALECATKILSFFNKYFDIPYPLPVLDLIAIPDFTAGAMENWGAITYRETTLLVDPVHSSVANKQRVALTIAHELAHQWFGNLVTMEWWTHLWLNEGFARYIEYLAVDTIFPNWDIWTQFIYIDLGRALHIDALKNTHPIEVNVAHPNEIVEVFDGVSYSKGASVIRMLAAYLGEDNFRNGIRYYLKKHSYANTVTEHLWKALEKISGKPVGKIMADWTGKSGHPLLTVTEHNKHIYIRQSRFFSSPLVEKQTKDKTLWRIPVSFCDDDGKEQKVIMDKKTLCLPKKYNRCLKFNNNESGFYRTCYSKSMWDELGRLVETQNIKVRDRLGLIRDSISLSEVGKLTTLDALQFAQHYKNETEYAIWAELSAGLSRVHLLIAHEACLQKYERFVISIFANIAQKTTWQKSAQESHSQTLLRSLVIANLGAYGHQATIAQAKKMFRELGKEHSSHIPADLRGVVYNIVSKYGGVAEHAKLIKMYNSTPLHEEKDRIGRALGNFRQKNLLKKSLDFFISKSVRYQDAVHIILPVMANPVGGDVAWKFIKTNWEMFMERYGGSHDVAYLVSSAGYFHNTKYAKDIEKFFQKNPAPGAQRSVQQALERIYSNAAWLARDKKKLANWLDNF